MTVIRYGTVTSTRKKQAEVVTWASGITTTSGVVRSGPQREECSKHLRKGRKNSLGRRGRSKPYKGQLARVGRVGKRSEGRRATVTAQLPPPSALHTALLLSAPFLSPPLVFSLSTRLLGAYGQARGNRDIPFPCLLGMAALVRLRDVR